MQTMFTYTAVKKDRDFCILLMQML